MPYLDNNATTAIAPEVLEVMHSAYAQGPINPSSIHTPGKAARALLIAARDEIAAHFQVKSTEVIFTSGGTEAINLILKSVSGQVITSNVEHAAVYNTLSSATLLPAGLFGAIQPAALEAALQPTTRLIALIGANNETGVKTDILSIAAIAAARNIPLFIDATAWIGKEPFPMHPGITAIAFSAHKFHGPLGVGCAIVRKPFKITPLITGGHQELGRRGGTENLPGIIGCAKALSLITPEASAQMRQLRDRFEKEILSTIPDVLVNGEGPRIANTTNLSFLGVEGEMLLMRLDLAGLYVSHGSACSSGALEPSRILLNMGLDKKRAGSALRFSLSRFTTEDECAQAIALLTKEVIRLRG